MKIKSAWIMAALSGAAIIVVGATCASTSQPVSSQTATAPFRVLAFEREVSPFAVTDRNAVAYDLPFLGGTDVPRPQFVDIDGDQDYDLFMQEYPNQLWFFENVGTVKAPKFVWRSNKYLDLDIGEWFRFQDIDADGDVDLVGEEPYSYVRYYRNTGTAKSPQFMFVDSLRDTQGTPIFMDRQNIPAFADVDCDSRLDFFVGRVDGTVTHYEASAPGSERFVFQEDRYQDIEVIGAAGAPDSVGTSRHGANALALADYDNDGDQDLFWGDYFERGALLIENVGRTCSSPTYTRHVPLPGTDTRTSGYNIPTPVDLDRDGDMDFLMGVLGGAFNPFLTATDNFYHWERTSASGFALRTTRFLNQIDFGSESSPALADIDGDGDLDIFVGNKLEPANNSSGRVHVLMNEGTRTAPRYRTGETLALVSAFHQKPTFGDLDGDGDLDMMLGTWNTDVMYFRNDGSAQSPRFVQDTALTLRPPRVTNGMPVLADMDGDSDLDLLVGESNGTLKYFRNDGTRAVPRFVLESEKYQDIDVGRASAPAVVDVDSDGLPDLVIGRETLGVAVYRNAGTRAEPKFVEFSGLTLPLPPLSTPTFGDIDGDGKLDMVSGTTSGGLLFFRGR